MKNIPILLLIICLGFTAQGQTTDADAAARDAILRRALRAAMSADTNGVSNAAPATAVAAAVVVTNAAPTNLVVPAVTASAVPIAAASATNAAATKTAPAVLPIQPPPSLAAAPVIPAPANLAQVPAAPTAPTAPAAPAAPSFPARRFPPNANTNRPHFAAPPAPVSPAAPPQMAEQPKPEEPLMAAGTIDFRSMTIDQVLPVYAELVGRTILRGNSLPQATINLTTQTPLTKSEAIQAFDSVLAMNGITMINVGDKFVKAVPVGTAYQQGAPFTTATASQLPEADQYVTHIAQLRYAKPTEVLPVLSPLAQIPNSILAVDSSQILIIRDYAANVKRMLELLKQIDVTVPMEYDSEVIPIKYAQASDIASALSSLGGGTGTTIGHGSTVGRGQTGNVLGSGGGALGSTGGFGGTSSGFGNNGINQGAAGGGIGSRTSSFGDRLNQIVSKAASQGEFEVLGKTKIIADARTNSLLVFASKRDMDMIKKIVSELDIVLAQVLIEAIIMEVSLDNSHSMGVSYLQQQASQPGNYFSGQGAANNGTFLNPGSFVNSGTNASALPSGLSYLANFGGDFSATLTAIANDSSINVLSKPRIQTSHGVAATLQVGQQVPIVSGTYFGGINGTASSQYQEQFVGISLTVTPLINPDGLVVMDISQNVQQLGPNYTIDGNPVPSTTQRSAQATVSVKDRDTIILGGMIQTSKNVSNGGVPLLKDIPGLGWLFRSSSSDKQRTELIVLIRPTVLPTPEAAALVATHERDRLPGIKAAERESRIDENRRLEQSDKIKVPKERD